MNTDYPGLDVTYEGQVATIKVPSPCDMDNAVAAKCDIHWELGRVFSDLRGENSIRAVILTGMKERFLAAPLTTTYASEEGHRHRNDPVRHWKVFTGIVRCLEAMVALEKPIIARVNGDAVGFGSSIMFASDIIIAREDVRIADMHMGMGEVAPYGPPYGIVPGDGGFATVPLYMSPAKSKEYLMLAQEYTGAEMAQMNIINYAVPAEQLDAKVEEIIARLLKRSSYALAWTKRIANRNFAAHMNMTVDAGAAYEIVNFHQIEKMNWNDKLTLD